MGWFARCLGAILAPGPVQRAVHTISFEHDCREWPRTEQVASQEVDSMPNSNHAHRRAGPLLQRHLGGCVRSTIDEAPQHGWQAGKDLRKNEAREYVVKRHAAVELT